MGKNLIPIIAEELGVEIGEEFLITHETELEYKFTTQSLLERDLMTSSWEDAEDGVLVDLIVGARDVVKIPFTPKTDESYWSYFGGVSWRIACTLWTNDSTDLCRKACGCVFRTREEAIKARPAKYKELTGKDWSGENG